jgi:hypothetical protein
MMNILIFALALMTLLCLLLGWACYRFFTDREKGIGRGQHWEGSGLASPHAFCHMPFVPRVRPAWPKGSWPLTLS